LVVDDAFVIVVVLFVCLFSVLRSAEIRNSNAMPEIYATSGFNAHALPKRQI